MMGLLAYFLQIQILLSDDGKLLVQKYVCCYLNMINYTVFSTENQRSKHEDYQEFQKTFFNDIQKLHQCFKNICYQFQEQMLCWAQEKQ